MDRGINKNILGIVAFDGAIAMDGAMCCAGCRDMEEGCPHNQVEMHTYKFMYVQIDVIE